MHPAPTGCAASQRPPAVQYAPGAQSLVAAHDEVHPPDAALHKYAPQSVVPPAVHAPFASHAGAFACVVAVAQLTIPHGFPLDDARHRPAPLHTPSDTHTASVPCDGHSPSGSRPSPIGSQTPSTPWPLRCAAHA